MPESMEAKIARMEAMEKDLIRQLRSTQVQQLEAYADLEERITEPLPPTSDDDFDPDAELFHAATVDAGY